MDGRQAEFHELLTEMRRKVADGVYGTGEEFDAYWCMKDLEEMIDNIDCD